MHRETVRCNAPPSRAIDAMSVAALPPRKRKIALAISQDASDDDRAVKAEHETPAPALHDEEPQAKKKPTRQGYRIAHKKPTLTSPAAAEPEAVQVSPPSARVKEEPARQERRGSPGEAKRLLVAECRKHGCGIMAVSKNCHGPTCART